MVERAREIIDRYQRLEIGRNFISCPYYMNVAKKSVIDLLRRVDVPGEEIDKFSSTWRKSAVDFGRFQGKGLPDEIAGAALQISRKIGLPIENADPMVVVEVMKHLGLGIDCSGFVFNVLRYAFEADGKLDKFVNSLAWEDTERRDASRAGTFVFAGKASYVIEAHDLRGLDLLLMRGLSGKYIHVALLLPVDNGEFEVVQSTLLAVPTGVNFSRMKVVKQGPVFEFIPGLGKRWEEIFAEGRIEFRRLAALAG
ncbi:MAG: hypothetical protein AAB548_01680 [Patescibacteria group bacterium]